MHCQRVPVLRDTLPVKDTDIAPPSLRLCRRSVVALLHAESMSTQAAWLVFVLQLNDPDVRCVLDVATQKAVLESLDRLKPSNRAIT